MLRPSTISTGSSDSAILLRSRSSRRLSLHKLRWKTDDPVSWDDPRQVRDQAREIRTARRLATYMEDHSTTMKIHVHVDSCYERFIGIDLVNMLYFVSPMYVPQLGHINVAYSSDSLMDDKITEDLSPDGETVVDTMDMRRRIYFPMESIAGYISKTCYDMTVSKNFLRDVKSYKIRDLTQLPIEELIPMSLLQKSSRGYACLQCVAYALLRKTMYWS